LSSEVNLITPDGKARLINQAKPYVEKLKAVGLQVMLKQQLANMVELPANAVESILNNRSRYAFYTNYVKANPHLEYKTKTPLPVINSIELIIANLLKNPNLAVSYNLPEPDNFHHYSPELQELILLIDYISHNYEDTAIIAVDEIESKLNFKTISLNKPLNNHSQITLASNDFKEILNRIFGLKKAQAIKIPRIKMKETP
jgi:DNA primase